ncbi:MAG TPA: hypothetical protein VFQ53_02765 [Kofleriaceae bacterium]|nr:hypothetical protein [Kofleriaceae bacterium]
MIADLSRVLDEADARQLPALIEDWLARDDAFRWIARALRLDLPVLVERPELVAPCLHRRIAWLDAYDADAFFVERAPLPRELSSLHRLTHAWFAEVLASQRWLRSLRPQPLPLDAAVVEEYRTSADGELRLSNDGALIGVVGEHATVAWERATGRRVEAAALPAAPDGRGWTLGDAGAGTIVLVLDARDRIELGIEHRDEPRDVRELSDELVLVEARDDEYDPRYYVVDVVARRIVALDHAEARCAACSPDGARVYVGHRSGVTVHWIRERRIETWSGVDVEALAVAGDDTVATRSGAVIRIWDRERAAGRGFRFRVRDAGPAGMWSPDGQRLVTGTLLCDAASGRVIADLPLTIGGWLEGGPPRDCRALCNGVFAEVMPMGLRAWDARDGKLVVDDRRRAANPRDTVAFDPQGRYYAHCDSHGDLTVSELRSGRVVLAVTTQRRPGWDHVLQFSADGAQLWWTTASGGRSLVALAEPAIVHRLSELAPVPATFASPPATVRDGMLVAGDVALPFDEPAATVSPDGRGFACRRSHVVLRDGW